MPGTRRDSRAASACSSLSSSACGGGERRAAQQSHDPDHHDPDSASVGPAAADAAADARETGQRLRRRRAPACSARQVHGDPALVYVPNSMSNTVDVISQRTMRVVAQFPTGALPQHVTPSWDLKTLYVDNDLGNTLTPIDPRTGRPGQPIPVEDPYNLYFTPDGRFAIVVAERLQRLDFRRPGTMALVHSLSVPVCRGVDHMDFSAGGRYAYRQLRVRRADDRGGSAHAAADAHARAQPRRRQPPGRQARARRADRSTSPISSTAGCGRSTPRTFRVLGFLHTGAGAHGLYPSRDARFMYVSNRLAGTVSVVSFRTRRVVATWQLPLPASPDMGGVSADGRTLWLSGRYNAVVYAINTRTGRSAGDDPGRAPAHTACACGPSRGATRSATPGSCAEPPSGPGRVRRSGPAGRARHSAIRA